MGGPRGQASVVLVMVLGPYQLGREEDEEEWAVNCGISRKIEANIEIMLVGWCLKRNATRMKEASNKGRKGGNAPLPHSTSQKRLLLIK